MSSLLIQNANVLQISKESPTAAILHHHDILVTGNRISSIQPTGQTHASHFSRTVAADGLLAMPGLINTHAHVPMVIFRGLAEDVSIEKWFNDYMWPLESNLQADDVYWGMQLGLAEMIEGGVTTVADHYFFMDLAAQAVEKAGTRALLGWAIFGSNGPEMIEKTGQFVAEWNHAADGRITTIMAPHAPYTCDDDFLKACAAKADELGVGIHIHAAETLEQTQASLEKRGITPIQVLEQTGILDHHTIIAHGCGLLPEDIERLAKRTAGIACAPKTYMKLASGMTPVIELRAARVPVGLATDGAVSNNTLDIFESLRLMAMMQKVRHDSAELMTIPEALHVATRGSAAVLGMADQIGSLEPGFLADIILVNLGGVHHQPLHSVTASLVYNTRASDVQTVIVNGQVIMEDRKLYTINKDEIIAEVKSGMERLAQRQPDRRIQVYNP
ncbi:MAG TPA: amidohydrolase [Spirillospora sp.]|nr:amidohydrolase [Spirillospora sp.]